MRRKPDPFLIDDENPEWTAEDFNEARPLRDTPEGRKLIAGMKKLAAKRRAELKRIGRPPLGDAPKVHIGFRLDADVVASIRATGPGYNARVEKVLRSALAKGRL
jgi:uncharacterized protein (DUF4415 family)